MVSVQDLHTLCPFQADHPAAWFGAAEGLFQVKCVYDQHDNSHLMLVALFENQKYKVTDLMAFNLTLLDMYHRLKERLLQLHLLDDFPRWE